MSLENLKTPPSTPESQEVAPQQLNSEAYIQESLKRIETTDREGIIHPTYNINGRDIIFRNRQEAPVYDNIDVTVPGGESVYPVEIEALNPSNGEYEPYDTASVREYIDSRQADAPLMAVTNTPEGVMYAAAALTANPEDSILFNELADKLADGKTWDESEKAIIDTLLAAVTVDDEGQLPGKVNPDGWAVGLAAILGDEQARGIIDARIPALIDSERAIIANSMPGERGLTKEYEPIDLDKIALVHSTSHDIMRNEDGNIVLRTAGQQRDDKLPRASLHFTLNSQVGDVYAGADKQVWDEAQSVIVANFKEVINTNKTLPKSMDGIDTWFMLNPGQELALPNALVVEPVEATASGRLIEETADGVQYVLKSEYTSEEAASISELSLKYGARSPKEVALRMAMERAGVPVDLMDSPSDDGHGMASSEIGRRIWATAESIGLPSGKHFGTPEEYTESDVHFNLRDSMVGQVDSMNKIGSSMKSWDTVSLEARRQILASGYYPARPETLSDRVKAQVERSSQDSGV